MTDEYFRVVKNPIDGTYTATEKVAFNNRFFCWNVIVSSHNTLGDALVDAISLNRNF